MKVSVAIAAVFLVCVVLCAHAVEGSSLKLMKKPRKAPKAPKAPQAAQAQQQSGELQGDGPWDISCAQGNNDCQQAAQVVASLASKKRRPFIDPKNGAGPNAPLSALQQAEEKRDAKDAVIIQLTNQLNTVKTTMVKNRQWVNNVQRVVKHYRTKVGQVELSLRAQAQLARKLNSAIQRRHKQLTASSLQTKMKEIQTQLSGLQFQSQQVNGQTSQLTQFRNQLRNRINQLQTQIRKLQA